MPSMVRMMTGLLPKQKQSLWCQRDDYARDCGRASRAALDTGDDPRDAVVILDPALRLPPAKYWAVLRDHQGRNLNPALVSHHKSTINQAIKSRRPASRHGSASRAIFTGFASLREIRLYCLTAGVECSRKLPCCRVEPSGPI